MPDSPENASPKTALLLANLGTPEAPAAQAVRRYLSEFLMDRRVVQIPRLLWWPLLHWVILPRRSPVVAEKYGSIWMEGGSPLGAFTRQLSEAVQARLPHTRVYSAMRYGEPSLAGALARLSRENVQRVIVLPLYPQYSTTTTASVEDVIETARRAYPQMRIDVLHDYHRDPHWVNAVADSIRAHWAQQGRGERLLLSYHGLPERVIRAGDPYAAQCEASTAAITEALGLSAGEVVMTYQSRFGRGRWLQPHTQQTIEQLARDGVKRIDVACPGFAVDCLETLEEIAQLNAEAFVDAGGEQLSYISCLNASDAHAEVMVHLARTLP